VIDYLEKFKEAEEKDEVTPRFFDAVDKLEM